MGILAPKNYGLLRNCDTLRVQFEGILRLADLGVTPACYVPDEDWTIEDPATCTIADGVITWNRVSADSFIRLQKPADFVPGAIWRLEYEVINNSGVGGKTIYCSGQSSIETGRTVNSDLGLQREERETTDGNYLLRWTPQNDYDGQTLVVRNVRVYPLPCTNLGPNVVSNGTFDTDLSDWSVIANATWEAPGVMRVTSVSGESAGAFQNCLVGERTFCWAVDVVIDSGQMRITLGNGGPSVVFTESGHYEGQGVAADATLFLVRNAACNGTFDNVIARQIN